MTAHTSTGQPSTAQSATAQSGAAHTSTIHTSTAPPGTQFSTALLGAEQSDPAHASTEQSDPAQVSTAQSGTAQPGTGQISTAAGLPGRETARSVRPAAAAQQALTLMWRTVVKIKHVPEQLMDVSLQPIVFIVLFVFVLGGGLFGNWHQALQYMLPGILMQTLVFATMGIGIGLNTDLTKGIFDRFRSLPIARSAPLVGLVLGDAVRYVISGAMVLGFGMAIGFRVHTNLLAAVAAFVLVIAFALALCWVTAWVGIIAKGPESVQGFVFVVMFPLTFGSNIFAATSSMPGWLQAWVKVNPISQIVTAERGLLLGGPVASPALQALAWAAGLVVVFFPLSVVAYRRRSR